MANILHFPRRIATTAEPADRSDPQQLRGAVGALSEAVENQRAAVTQWQKSLSELREAIGSLEGSVAQYRRRLEGLQDMVGTLHEQSGTLGALADPASAAVR